MQGSGWHLPTVFSNRDHTPEPEGVVLTGPGLKLDVKMEPVKESGTSIEAGSVVGVEIVNGIPTWKRTK